MTSEEMMSILLEKIAGLEAKVESMKEQEGVLVYDTKGLAKALKMSPNYAGKLMATRGFPSTKVGGAWKVGKKALEDWLRHQEGHEIELNK